MNPDPLEGLSQEELARLLAARQRVRALESLRMPADATATRPARPSTVTPSFGSPFRMLSPGTGMVEEATGLITGHEGFRPRAYRDTAGRNTPWTVGYGRTGRDVGPTTTMTEPEARRWVENRVRADSAQMARAGIPVNAGLLSFAYNVGQGKMRRLGVADAARAGDWERAADIMQSAVYGRQDGRPVRLRGLERRRADEVNALPRNRLRELLGMEDAR